MRHCFRSLLFLAAIFNLRADWSVVRWTSLGVLEGGATAWEAEASTEARSVRLQGISFASGRCALRVIDSSPDNRRSLQAALAATRAVGGSNGGYFHKDFTPLGLVVREGETLHSFERSKLLSGVLIVRKSRMELLRSQKFRESPDIREALQAGPWLVEKGAAVAGLNDQRFARRTVVANDGKGHWAIIATSAATLAHAARILCLKGIAGPWTIANALNLDGGSSTALRAEANEQVLIDIRSFGPVRNYLAIVPRDR
jgi:uncharacterized protein YigE (DUF2233 family)